jgi:hypothetical protein
MTLAFGHASKIDVKFESAYGTLATGDFITVPVDSFTPGVEKPWERMDVVGLAGGRNEPVPMRGLLSVQPQAEVPIDLEAFGIWLKLMFGAPTTAGSTNFTHTFVAGGSTLPSLSLQNGNTQMSSEKYSLFAGLRGSTMEIPFRFGEAKQTATIAMIGTSEVRQGTSGSGTPSELGWTPFSGAVGTVKREGTALARVTGGNLRISNGLEVLREANRAGAAITEAAPGIMEITGALDVRLDSDTLLDDADADSSVELELGYVLDSNRSLKITVHAAWLNRTRPALRGRAGIQTSFAFRGTYDSGEGKALTAVLANQVASY